MCGFSATKTLLVSACRQYNLPAKQASRVSRKMKLKDLVTQVTLISYDELQLTTTTDCLSKMVYLENKTVLMVKHRWASGGSHSMCRA